MKLKQKRTSKQILSDKIADALTVKPRADIEDDQVFGTKPKTVSRADLSSSDSEVDAAISDFRKRNVNLLSEISKKYEGEVIARKELGESGSEGYEKSDSDSEKLTANDDGETSNDSGSDHKHGDRPRKSQILPKISKGDDDDSIDSEQSLTAKLKQLQSQMKDKNSDISDSENFSSDDGESDDYSITQYQKQFIENKATRKDKKPTTPKSKKSKIEKKQKAASNSEDDTTDEGDKNDYNLNQIKKQIQGSDQEDSGDTDSDDEVESGEDDEGQEYDISQLDEPLKEEFEHVKKQNVSEEVKKGTCVRNQLLLWEGLLEMRIHLQRCMNTANQMPFPETYEQLKTNNEFVEECTATKENIANVLDKFLLLQNILFKNFPETKGLSTKQQSSEAVPEKKEESDEEIPSDTDNEEIPSDTENEEDEKDEIKSPKKNNSKPNPSKKRKLEDYEKELSATNKAFKSFRDATIQKWNDKTRLATAANIKNAPTNTILQQISYILSDREKLVRRTQLKRSEYDIVGYKKTEDKEQNGDENPVTKGRKDDDEYIPEIFDDSDFYHQLLRELIECKSADISDPVQLSRQWIALQQMRSKMKRKVDTKATKGRKIKYVVHNQLVNFMAPEKSTTWTDESTNELYSSLFGKMFEHNNVGLNTNVENGFRLKN